MRKIKLVALLTFVAFSDADLDTFCTRVYKALFGNAFFPTLQAFLPDFKAKAENYSSLLSVAKGGSRTQQEQKNTAKKAVIAILRLMAEETNHVAKGDREQLLSSGFEIYGSAKKQALPVLKAA